jgi:hypothetical protein
MSLKFLRCLEEKLDIGRIAHLSVNQDLIACLVMRANGHAVNENRIHPVNIDIHY